MSPTVEFWVDVGLRAAPIIVAVFAGIVAWWNYRQKRDADKRNAWWERMRWPLEHINSDNEEDSTLAGRYCLNSWRMRYLRLSVSLQ